MRLSELNRLEETLERNIQSILRGIPAYLLSGKVEEAKQESERYLKLRSLKESLVNMDIDNEIIEKIKMEMF